MAKRLPAAATIGQLMVPCHFETSMPSV